MISATSSVIYQGAFTSLRITERIFILLHLETQVLRLFSQKGIQREICSWKRYFIAWLNNKGEELENNCMSGGWKQSLKRGDWAEGAAPRVCWGRWDSGEQDTREKRNGARVMKIWVDTGPALFMVRGSLGEAQRGTGAGKLKADPGVQSSWETGRQN